MLTLPPTVKIYLAAGATDMRKSFDGLAAATREIVRQDPLSGHLFAFINRRRDRIKILFFDRSGFCILYKRLERGTFKFPRQLQPGARAVELDAGELSLMLEGIDLRNARRRRRWQPKSTSDSDRLRDGSFLPLPQ